jgi:hypothetical protein
MSSVLHFKNRFGQGVSIDEVKRHFVNQIKHNLIEPIDQLASWSYSEHSNSTALFDFTALAFNQSPAELIRQHNKRNISAYDVWRPSFGIFMGDDFDRTLILIEVWYSFFLTNSLSGYSDRNFTKAINDAVLEALPQPVSLGISWRAGLFYPEGAKELDKVLIEEVLGWLGPKDKTKELYKNALDHYAASLDNPIRRKDAISNAYQAVEVLTQSLVDGTKLSFDKNFSALINKLDLDKWWNKIFNAFTELSKEFGRHGGKGGESYIPNQGETEAFLYLSGIVMRLIIQRLKD